MTLLTSYLFRQLTTAFVFAASAVAFVIIFTQSFRLLSLVIENSSTMWIFFQLIGLSIPNFLPLVLPLGLGIATIFVYNKLAVDNEMVVMRASGISPARQAMPAFILAGIVFAVCLALTLWITPASNRGLVALQHKVRDGFAVFLSRPGNFNDITAGLTFYANKRDPSGALEGIIIHDVRKPETPVTIMADTGRVMSNEDQPQIFIFHGRRQELDITTGKLSELSFDQYVLDLNALRSVPEARLADPREQSVLELLNPSTTMLTSRASRETLLAELNQRLASPFLALSFTLIGVFSILAGEFNRRGMGKRILFASLAIIVLQASFMSVNSLITKHMDYAYALYLVAMAPLPLAFLLVAQSTGTPRKNKSRKRRMKS